MPILRLLGPSEHETVRKHTILKWRNFDDRCIFRNSTLPGFADKAVCIIVPAATAKHEATGQTNYWWIWTQDNGCESESFWFFKALQGLLDGQNACIMPTDIFFSWEGCSTTSIFSWNLSIVSYNNNQWRGRMSMPWMTRGCRVKHMPRSSLGCPHTQLYVVSDYLDTFQLFVMFNQENVADYNEITPRLIWDFLLQKQWKNDACDVEVHTFFHDGDITTADWSSSSFICSMQGDNTNFRSLDSSKANVAQNVKKTNYNPAQGQWAICSQQLLPSNLGLQSNSSQNGKELF